MICTLTKKHYLIKINIIILLIAMASGCASSQKMVRNADLNNVSAAKITRVEDNKPSSELKEAQEGADTKEIVPEVVEKGIVFAKTDFQGVLKTSFVKLVMENLEDKDKIFQLNIGEPSVQSPFSWDVKNVEPGYFYIEIPAGPYKISSISIPVGTTLATEEADIRFSVKPGMIQYVGTLKVIGTKERIKLGGVPVIKPGFEYVASAIDETEKAVIMFQERYPEIVGDINTEILILNKSSNVEVSDNPSE